MATATHDLPSLPRAGDASFTDAGLWQALFGFGVRRWLCSPIIDTMESTHEVSSLGANSCRIQQRLQPNRKMVPEKQNLNSISDRIVTAALNTSFS